MNPIACENSKTGNPASEWDISGCGQRRAFRDSRPTSASIGARRSASRSTRPRRRSESTSTGSGYYGGLGARKVATVPPSSTAADRSRTASPTPATGLVDCGNWSQSGIVGRAVNGAVSGIYIAKLVRPRTGRLPSHIAFVVRDDDGHSDMLFQTSDTTWQAYNQYGGNSLYVRIAGGTRVQGQLQPSVHARAATSPEDWVFNAEYPMVRWLEANGYNVSYSTGVDTDRRGAELLEHKVFLSVGHDEYWSGAQRTQRRGRAGGRRAPGVLQRQRGLLEDPVGEQHRRVGDALSHAGLLQGNPRQREDRSDAGVDRHLARSDDSVRRLTAAGRENALTGTIFTVNCGTNRHQGSGGTRQGALLARTPPSRRRPLVKRSTLSRRHTRLRVG